MRTITSVCDRGVHGLSDATPMAARAWRPGSPQSSTSKSDSPLITVGMGASEIIAIDSLTAQQRMVEAGFGLALLPESSVDEELRTGTLRALKVPAIRVTLPVVLIHRRRAYLSGAVRRLMAVLAAKPIERTPHGRREPRAR